MFPVIVPAVPVTLPLIGLLNVFVPVHLLLPLNKLELEEVISERNAIDCVALFLSRNCRWGSMLTSHTSPTAGVLGAVVLLGTFNEANPAADGTNVCLPPPKMLARSRRA